MARTHLAILLAALPCLAQVKYNTVDILPSGGAVGQVCFYETAANGSNKVCLSAAASLAGDVAYKLPAVDGSAGEALTTDGSGQLSWSSVGTPPFDDDNPLVRDETDTTKELRFDVSGFTTATVRAVTVPDASFTMAGVGLNNAFSVDQDFLSGRINIGASGSSGPGIRDNAGVLECTDDGSTWLACGPSSVTNYWSRTGTTITTATAGDVLKLDSHLLFSAPSASDIADATNYAQTLFVENVDAAPSGVTGNYLKGRKIEVADDAGGTGIWDIQARAISSYSSLYIRDNGGVKVIEFHRTSGSSPVDYADVYVDLLPDTSGGQKLGQSGRHWNQVWATDAYHNYLNPLTGTVIYNAGHIVPLTNNTYDIGASTERVKKLWVVDIDCSGTCWPNYWTRTGTTLSTTTAGDNVDVGGLLTLSSHLKFTAASVSDIGDATNYFQTAYGENANFAPSGVTSNYVKIRKLEVVDDAGGTSFWDFQSKANATNSTFYLRDASGGLVVDFHRIDSTAAVDYANFYVDLYPDSGGSQKLGKSGQHWGQLWATDTYTNYLHQLSGSYIYSYAHLAPGANATYDLGEDSTPFRWRNFYFTGSLVQAGTTRLDGSGNATVNNLTVSGTCTGCGSGTNYWTRSGTDVRPATDGDDVTVRTSGGTQTHRLRASDGAHLAGAIYTGTSPTWTQRIDSSGNVTALSLTVNSTYFINSSGAAFLGTVTLGDIYQSGPTSRLSSGGVFNGASFNVAGTEVISSGRVFKPVSLDVNGTANVIDSSRNATFTGLTFGASSALVQGSTTRISTGGKGTFVGVEIGSGQSLDQGGTARVDASGNGRFASLYIGATQRIDSSGNMNTPSITIATSYSIGSGGTAILGSVFATDYWQGATSRISSSGVFNAASYQVSSTSVIDSSRNTNFANMKATGQLWIAYTDDNSWAIGDGGTNTTAKLAIYDTSGSFIGWVPVFP